MFYSGILGYENCYTARRNRVESQLCNSIHLHLIVQMWKSRAEQSQQQGEQQLFFVCKTLTTDDIKKITRNSNVELHRPSEKVDVLKQFMLCSKVIFKICKNCHSENIFNRSTFCRFGYKVSPATVSNVNILHTKTIRLSMSCGPLWNWPYFYVLCPQGAINNNTIKLNKYNPNDSQGQ